METTSLPLLNNENLVNVENEVVNDLDNDDMNVQKPERYSILTKRMSYWINILRTFNMIHVMMYHYSWRVSINYGQQSFCDFVQVPKESCPRKWKEIFLPHPLVGFGTASTCFFFAMAGFFSQLKFEQLFEKYQKQTGRFLLSFLHQYVKRYLQIHAVLFVFGLGYGGFLYYMFGEKGRDVYYLGPRAESYWAAFYMPVYWPGRIWQYCDLISGASWFSLSLMNVEFIFYCIYLLSYFVRKYVGPKLAYSIPYMLVLTAGFIVFYFVYTEDRNVDSNLYYLAGLWLYWARKWTVDSRSGRKMIDFMYTKRGQITRLLLFTVLIYTWLVISRIEYRAGMVFILIPLLFDALPAYEFKGFFQAFFKEMNRIGMAFYILHQPIIMTAMPKHFPSITPKDLNGINSISANWFVAWWYVFIFAGLSYPLWFMIQPLEKCLDFFINIKQEYQNKQKFWITIGLSMVSLTATTALIVLVQSDKWGHVWVAPPYTWW
ncbi:Conserved_hypothetical protein [Hexamita inflata]|uniref:Uncharacterized protein n=1 Tax=Hexamita inflata TaxID=28002 RepID=A0AA86VSY9_9EUKA|nr:Conserved hypothetical protein [Hexamita inflata]